MKDNSLILAATANVPAISIEAYIQRVNQIPMLSQEQEQELGQRLFNDGDLQAAQELILAHLRYVVKVAKNYMGYGLPLADLIQEGTVGLMKAVKRFDPNKNIRLVSFAVHWIKAEIHEFVLKNWRIVKVATTKAQRKLFFNLRGSKKRLGWSTEEEVASIAQDLGVKPEEVRQMELRLNSSDVSFSLPVSVEDEEAEGNYNPSLYLESKDPNPQTLFLEQNWQADAKQKFTRAFAELSERHQAIIKKRWLQEDKITLKELALEFKISTERVRQIEEQALSKLKESMLA